MGSGDVMETFLTELTTGMSASNVWGAIAPIAGLIVIVTLVATGRRSLNKNLKAIKNGSNGKV